MSKKNLTKKEFLDQYGYLKKQAAEIKRDLRKVIASAKKLSRRANKLIADSDESTNLYDEYFEPAFNGLIEKVSVLERFAETEEYLEDIIVNCL